MIAKRQAAGRLSSFLFLLSPLLFILKKIFLIAFNSKAKQSVQPAWEQSSEVRKLRTLNWAGGSGNIEKAWALEADKRKSES